MGLDSGRGARTVQALDSEEKQVNLDSEWKIHPEGLWKRLNLGKDQLLEDQEE